jgi:polyisoprenoid-binding protein YceI
MKRIFFSITIVFIITSLTSAQSFKIKAGGVQTFDFADKTGKNQATFFSATPLEDINGTSNSISGSVTFDVANFAKSLKGKITLPVSSINTGIELRNHHMQGANWLDAAKYPDISFDIKSVYDVKQAADNKLEFKALGIFSLHGVTKEVTAVVDATYLDESEQTQKRAPGDLLGVSAKFSINLSDYAVNNAVIGNKVAEKIDITVNIVGSNKK